MYYVLSKSYAENPSRHTELSSYPRIKGLWWTDGARFVSPFPSPISISLKPYDPKVPDMGPSLSSLYLSKIPLFKKELVSALNEIGVRNFDTYEVELLDPDTGEKCNTHVAVNIIGLVSAVDMDNSKYNIPDNIPLIDVEFDELVIDEKKAQGYLMFRLAENTNTILVHELVKNYLVEIKGFDDLEFYKPEDVALG